MSDVAAAPMEEYAVSDACIACDACCNDFPEIFIMNPEHTMAKAIAPSPKGKFNPWDIIYVCPVDAISLIKGDLPPPPEGKKKASHAEEAPVVLEDTRPWQVRWEEAKKRPAESAWERMKRYGMATTIDESLNEYHLRFALPERIPDHELKYRWSLPEKMPDYKFDVKLDKNGSRIIVKAWFEDDRVRRLSGAINSFPDRFMRELDLGVVCKDVKTNYNAADRILDVIIEKATLQ